MVPAPVSARAALAFLCLMVVWGSTYLAVTIVLRDVPVFISLSMRFFLTAAVLYAWLRWHSPRPLAGVMSRNALLSGVLLSGCGTGFTAVALLGIPTGVSALLNATIPICVTLLDWAWFSQRRPARITLGGLVLGFCGVVLVVGGAPAVEGWQGAGFVAAAAFGVATWSLGTLLQRELVPPERLLALNCVQTAAAGVFAALLATVMWEWSRFEPQVVSRDSWLALAYLVLIGSVLTQSCYLWLLARYPAEKVTTYAIINPAIALLLGGIFLGERVTGAGALGAALVLTGVTLVLFERPLRAWLTERLGGE
jgi:drug/metabolite transporter (DMT)-like permease